MLVGEVVASATAPPSVSSPSASAALAAVPGGDGPPVSPAPSSFAPVDPEQQSAVPGVVVPLDTPPPAGSALPSEARAAFFNSLARRTDALLPMPIINKRRYKSGATPRRSRRLAGADVEFPLNDLNRRTKKAMRSLDIISENEGIDQQALDDYAKLFGHPLSDSQLQALAALFNWSLPDDLGQGEDTEMLG